ncbi:hypothetical protein [Cohnella soli]|uniref:Uncharacterized protein n=1 Tax=Cohnella soli TaxID=425005 RepID=A0ABW0I2X3_9BACL
MLIQEYAAYRIWKTERELAESRLFLESLGDGSRTTGRRAAAWIWLIGLVLL